MCVCVKTRLTWRVAQLRHTARFDMCHTLNMSLRFVCVITTQAQFPNKIKEQITCGENPAPLQGSAESMMAHLQQLTERLLPNIADWALLATRYLAENQHQPF